MKVLDLFCGAGGASVGYARAGAQVTGVDINPQKRYPYTFVQADALQILADYKFCSQFDVIHASPPCQLFTKAQVIRGRVHPDLIEPTRKLLIKTEKPWIIENVEGAPLLNPVLLCGVMFPELLVYRHRLFETNWTLEQPVHGPHIAPLRKMGRSPQEGEFMHVVGHFSNVPYAKRAMGIDWMDRNAMSEAIPPAYTAYVGRQLAGVVG